MAEVGTRVVNDKAVTRTEDTVVNPDGTRTTTMSSSGDGDDGVQPVKRRAIRAGHDV